MQSPVSSTIKRSWGGSEDEPGCDEVGVGMNGSGSFMSTLSSIGSVEAYSSPLTRTGLEPITLALRMREPKSHFLWMV